MLTLTGIRQNPPYLTLQYTRTLRKRDKKNLSELFDLKQIFAQTRCLKLSNSGKALQKEEMAITIFIEELFGTYNDIENRAMVRRFATEDLNLVGIGLRGKKNQVDKLLKGIPLHS